MPITINGTGTIAGISVGGLENGCVNEADLATAAVTNTKLASGAVTPDKLASTVVGPVFEASLASNQSVTSGTLTKVQLNTKGFDTANCFDAVTNYRFTPNVSGYYQFNALVQGVAGSGSVTALVAVIRKNGSTDRNSTSATGGAFISSAVSCIYYMNGSTDYVEFYCQVNATSPYLVAGPHTFLSGCLLRP